MDELVAFLRARRDEDALWAAEASRWDDGASIEGGAHWQWVDPETDEVVTLNPDQDEFVNGDRLRVSLRSREEAMWGEFRRMLPQFVIHSAEEVRTAVGGHIARHDPARVLREAEAKRKIVEDYASALSERQAVRAEIRKILHTDPDAFGELSRQENALIDKAEALLPIVRIVSTVYADHPDYREEWRP
ncbi:DUF6221 family protein [Actinacidiphila sp. DG2A-62]|uniref:DUF6221 family protein n=1 Tax=Actinacidiphila sp. DG2A-62 TaxID=3108821 RepID=UPI002DB84963|nr:DUF6221 family protein [Actinacidiphila sp. DG2A-62]MEC3994023.1 DUF6221 family protein [Actinacidiphila sp. DG2A-62]